MESKNKKEERLSEHRVEFLLHFQNPDDDNLVKIYVTECVIVTQAVFLIKDNLWNCIIRGGGVAVEIHCIVSLRLKDLQQIPQLTAGAALSGVSERSVGN